MNTTEEISPAEYCAAFLVDFLASVGVVRAELTFSGSGDSGDVDDVQFTFKRNRKPPEENVEEQWRLAVARHHLLYPEHSIRCFDQDNGDSKLASLVQNFFYTHISESLGDWVNNEGGGGSVTVDTKERLISYTVSYNEVQDAEPVTGRVDRMPLFEELFAAVQALGITAIDADLDFDYEGVSWSENVTFSTRIAGRLCWSPSRKPRSRRPASQSRDATCRKSRDSPKRKISAPCSTRFTKCSSKKRHSNRARMSRRAT